MMLEKLDKLWCSALAASCDLKAVTAITKKVEKQEAKGDAERFGQWCAAVLKHCLEEQAGRIIAAVAVDAWKADQEVKKDGGEGEDV